jgi:saccharopine dehydrogenase (NAD+, L-lysine-forming)
MSETAKGGPFSEIIDNDIFINCVYLSRPIPPFITSDMLTKERQLSVVVDVSCDVTNPNNPIPFCNFATTFNHPTKTITPE